MFSDIDPCNTPNCRPAFGHLEWYCDLFSLFFDIFFSVKNTYIFFLHIKLYIFFRKIITLSVFIVDNSNKNHLWQLFRTPIDARSQIFENVFSSNSVIKRICFFMFFKNYIFKNIKKYIQIAYAVLLKIVPKTHWWKKIYSKLEIVAVIIFQECPLVTVLCS